MLLLTYYTKRTLFVLFLSYFWQFSFSQTIQPSASPEKLIEIDTCIFQIKIVDIIPIDSLHNEVKKAKVLKLIDYLGACDPKFKFDKEFKEKEFRLIIPNYLNKVSYELGNQHFAIVLSDTT